MGGSVRPVASNSPKPPKGVPANATPTYSSGGRGAAQVLQNWTVKNADETISTWNPSGTFVGKFNLPKVGPQRDSGGGLFDNISKGVTEFVQDPAKATTNALQPIEKTVNYIGAHPEMQVALAFAAVAPYASAQIAPYLSALGSYAPAAANAITSITVSVAQGVPIEKATENAVVNLAVSGVTGQAAQQINKVISSPAITNAITSTVSSGLASAAKGGSQADIEKAMTAGLAGSTASSLYKSAVDSTGEFGSRVVGGTTAGAVTGGTEGAVIGGLSEAAANIGKLKSEPSVASPLNQTAAETAKLAQQEATLAGAEKGAYLPATSPAMPDQTAAILAQIKSELPVAALPPGQVAALQGAVSPDTTSQSDVAESPASVELPTAKVASLDITQDQSPAETARLERQNAELAAATPAMPDQTEAETARLARQDATIASSSTPAEEPKQGAYLPSTPIEEPKQGAYLPAGPEPVVVPEEPKQGAYLPGDSVVPEEPKQGAYLPDAGPEGVVAPVDEESIVDSVDDSETDTTTTPDYKPDIFIKPYVSPKKSTPASTRILGQALGTTTGLTAFRDAGEIEGTGTGGKRKNVWNEESLKLKDALGV